MLEIQEMARNAMFPLQVIINPAGDHLDAMVTKMEGRKARAKAAKKAKKREISSSNGEVEQPSTSKDANGTAKKSKPSEKEGKKPSSSSGKQPKTIQEDRSKSEVYKSLFSSHKSAQNRPKGNWVTFDPRYN